MNNTTTILGIIVALAIGHASGYFFGQRGHATANTAQVTQLSDMMKADGAQMAKMGVMMMGAGAMMEERGVKFNDQEMVMMGKDLSVNGKKHEEDGRSMMGGDMMGMVDMPGMDH